MRYRIEKIETLENGLHEFHLISTETGQRIVLHNCYMSYLEIPDTLPAHIDENGQYYCIKSLTFTYDYPPDKLSE